MSSESCVPVTQNAPGPLQNTQSSGISPNLLLDLCSPSFPAWHLRGAHHITGQCVPFRQVLGNITCSVHSSQHRLSHTWPPPSSLFTSPPSYFFLKTESCYVAQAIPELMILLSQQCWDYRIGPHPHLPVVFWWRAASASYRANITVGAFCGLMSQQLIMFLAPRSCLFFSSWVTCFALVLKTFTSTSSSSAVVMLLLSTLQMCCWITYCSAPQISG